MQQHHAGQSEDTEDEEEMRDLRAAVARALSQAEREAQASQEAKALLQKDRMDAVEGSKRDGSENLLQNT